MNGLLRTAGRERRFQTGVWNDGISLGMKVRRLGTVAKDLY